MRSPETTAAVKGRARLSASLGAIVGLAAGLVLGTVLHRSGDPALQSLASAVEPLGSLWIRALRMAVIPLMASQLFASIVSARRAARSTGSLGAFTLALLVLFVVFASAYAVVLAPPLTSAIPVEPATVEAFRSSVSLPEGAAERRAAPSATPDGLLALIPTNPLEAAVNGDILSLLVFVALFALAVSRIAPERSKLIVSLAEGISEAMFVLVRWILKWTPIGVFALGLSLASSMGGESVRVLGTFVVLLCGLLLGFTLLLYPIAAVAGGVSPRSFARNVAPAQVVAIGTRSSLASLPVMMEVARSMRLPSEITAFVLPLAVTTLKIHRPVSSVANLFFLAHLFGIEVSGVAVVTFVVTVTLLRLSSPGMPGEASPLATLPAYLAVGIPIEGVILVEAVETIPDMFKTLVNVTGNLTLVTIVARWVPRSSAAPEMAGAPVEVEPVT